jgi:hypothetical protein
MGSLLLGEPGRFAPHLRYRSVLIPSAHPIAERRGLAYQMANLPGPVRKMIPVLIKASNSPSGEDSHGGFHEESLKWGRDSAGNVVVVRCKPGAYVRPGDPQAHTDFTAMDPREEVRMTSVEGFLHVHPQGGALGQGASQSFAQPPSAGDIKWAANMPFIHVVVGAYSQKVYFYDGKGQIGTPVPYKDVVGDRK